MKIAHKKNKAKGAKVHSLRSNDKEDGLIQLNKTTMVSLLNAQNEIANGNYSKASNMIQETIKILTNAK